MFDQIERRSAALRRELRTSWVSFQTILISIEKLSADSVVGTDDSELISKVHLHTARAERHLCECLSDMVAARRILEAAQPATSLEESQPATRKELAHA